MRSGSLEEMLEEFKNGTYDMTKNGKCTQCGACCSNLLPMSSKEVKEIKRYIEKHKIQEFKHLIPVVNQPMDMNCPFLNTDKSCEKCLIYPVRPMVCRKFSCNPALRLPPGNKNLAVIDVRETFFGKR